MEVKILLIIKRKYISVLDFCMFFKVVGFFGILILCLFGVLIVVNDLINFIFKILKILLMNILS